MTRPKTLGRFELGRLLGRGAQASVWLGYDPRLDREVAIKVMLSGAADETGDVGSWLNEARSVSRLTHPNIVPVFEADVHGEQAYLVFEYVPGRTLTEHLKARGALPLAEALALMLGVLDALQTAHAAGVVHRDLKPSNILIDGSGRARVMDFGIAARAADAKTQQLIVGTPCYMSPEATRGAAPSPAMDVFSAGLLMAELLSGRRLVDERDAHRAMQRIAGEDLVLPGGLAPEVDDTLRSLLMRALARDPAARFKDAASLRAALVEWQKPKAQAAPASAQNSGTLDFLLRRMRHKSDFPALSDSVVRIQRVASSEHESLGSLSNEILKDVALTNKLLRLVNTASYSHAGGGSISTVSRAVALIGFAGVRNLAMSLVLLEHMDNKAHAVHLKEEFLRALMAGTLAGELCPRMAGGEEAFIGALFQNLGRLLTEFYFPEEARQVHALVATLRGGAGAPRKSLPAAEAAASTSVLGLSFEDLGLGVARAWGLPDTLQRCMRRPDGEPPAKPPDAAGDRLRWLALASNEITDAVLVSSADVAAARIKEVAQRYTRVLGVSEPEIVKATEAARRRLAELAQGMGLQVPAAARAQRLMAPDHTLADGGSAVDTLTALQLTATSASPAELTEPDAPVPVVDVAGVLAAGIQDITNSMVEDFKLNEVLRMILETMFRALRFQRIVFCLRDPKTETLTGRFGLGAVGDSVISGFRVPLRSGNDLFTAVCVKGADTLISDATAANIAGRLPAWYARQLGAPAFLLLPLQTKGTTFALIYADHGKPGGIALQDKELALLRTLRNQAVMAFRQVA